MLPFIDVLFFYVVVVFMLTVIIGSVDNSICLYNQCEQPRLNGISEKGEGCS